jgi:hypothetical protein
MPSDDTSASSSSGEPNVAGSIVGVGKMQGAIDAGARELEQLNSKISDLNRALTNAISGLQRAGQAASSGGSFPQAGASYAAGTAQVRPGTQPSYGGSATLPNQSIPITASQQQGGDRATVTNSGAPGSSQGGGQSGGGGGQGGGGGEQGGPASVPDDSGEGHQSRIRSAAGWGAKQLGIPTTGTDAANKAASTALSAISANLAGSQQQGQIREGYYQQAAVQTGQSMYNVRAGNAFKQYNTFTSTADQSAVYQDALQMSGASSENDPRFKQRMGVAVGTNMMNPQMTGMESMSMSNLMSRPENNMKSMMLGMGGTLDAQGNPKGTAEIGAGAWKAVTRGAPMTRKGINAAFGASGSMRRTLQNQMGMSDSQITAMQKQMLGQLDSGMGAKEFDKKMALAGEDSDKGRKAKEELEKSGVKGLDSTTAKEKEKESLTTKQEADYANDFAKGMKDSIDAMEKWSKKMHDMADDIPFMGELKGAGSGKQWIISEATGRVTGDSGGHGGGPSFGGLGGGFPGAFQQNVAASGLGGGDGPGSGNEGLGAGNDGLKDYHGKTVKQALNFMASQSRNPSKSWAGMCLNSVNLAWGGNVGHGYDARQAYGYTKKRHKGGTPPAGAPLWWPGLSSHGHVALSAGGGMLWSNDIKRHGQIDKVSINFLKKKWGVGDPTWTEDIGGYKLPINLKNTGGTSAGGEGDDEEEDSEDEKDEKDSSSGGGAINAIGDLYGSANEKDVLSSAMGASAGVSGPGSSEDDKEDESTEDEAADEDKDSTGANAEDNPSGTGVDRWKPTAKKVAKELGRPASDATYILKTIKKESGGDPNVVNKWDSNWQAGHPSVGLMQVIKGTFNAYAGKYKGTKPKKYGVSTNGHANIYAGSKYAISRYGSNGLQRAAQPGGYAKGAFEIPDDEDTTVHKGEMIIPRRSAETIRNALLRETQPIYSPSAQAADRAAGVNNSAAGGGGGGTVTFQSGAIQLNVNGAKGVNGKQLWQELRTAIENDDRIRKIGAGA